MTKEEIIKIKKEILKLEKKLEEFKNKVFSLGKRKMFIFDRGFGYNIKKRGNYDSFCWANSSENIWMEEERIIATYTDRGYDLYNSISIDISWEEAFSTEEENIEKWTKEFEEQNKEKELAKQKEEERRRLKAEKNEKKQYLKLKEKYG